MYDVAIIGGGLAGLTNAILLARAGLKVALFEKKKYPFHRVCGEYISNEVIPFLVKHDLFPTTHSPASIETLLISSAGGNHFSIRLDMGGFGISRFAYDAWLAAQATKAAVAVMDETTVVDVNFQDNRFFLHTADDFSEADLVICSHGKRSKFDQTLNRPFIHRRSPYVGVKYHIKADLPVDQVALHNFKGGYCGVSKIEEDLFNLCYLVHRDQVRKAGNVQKVEEEVLFRNPLIKGIFEEADFLFEKPLVINEISFEKKEAVYNHLLMAGDSAGMITPLCGNGMAMAIHSARLLSGIIIDNWNDGDFDRDNLEKGYRRLWEKHFARQMWAGRRIQGLFGSKLASEGAVLIGRHLKPIARSLIRQTHAKPFS